MSTPATRLITLIMLLQRQSNQKATDLARELGISVRTLHRYFDMLDNMGVPVYAERGPYGGFSLVRGYKMPPLALTPEEAVAVTLGTSLVTEMWGQLYQEAATGALAKLDRILPEEQRAEASWARKSLISTGMHRSNLDALGAILEKLRRATREHRRSWMQYTSRGLAEAGSREFDPYAIVHRWGWWYTIGFCHLRGAVRTFRVDRIREFTLLDQSFAVPGEFDIRAYLEQEQAVQPGFPVKLHFAPQVAFMAREYAIGSDSIEEQPDGGLIVTVAAPDVMWAASNALAYGPGVTVLAPEEVRTKVAEWALAVVGLYSDPKDDNGE